MYASPRARGAILALIAAALFGVSAPIAKLLLPWAGPLVLSSLLYLGGGVALLAWDVVAALLRRPPRAEARVSRADLPWLAGVIVCGGILGPLLMLIGLGRLSGLSASLLLTLEGPFTVLLALAVFREHLGGRALAAVCVIFCGSALVSVESGHLSADPVGVAAIAGACLSWAVDNNLTQRLTLRDPVAIVRWKGLGAGCLTLGVALCAGETLPPLRILGGALLLGAGSYGLSILLDMFALRLHGAARQAAYFASAPFIGAAAAIAVLGERPSAFDLVGGAVIAAGVIVLLRDRHGHLHTHTPVEHSHRHLHDEHHPHEHEGGATAPHAHPHRHLTLTHDHPHLADAHHRHRH